MILDKLEIQFCPVCLHAHVPQIVVSIRTIAFLDHILVGLAFLPEANVAVEASLGLGSMPMNDNLQQTTTKSSSSSNARWSD